MNDVLIILNIFAAGIVFTFIVILLIMGSSVKSTRFLALFDISIFVFIVNIIIRQLGYSNSPDLIPYASFYFPFLCLLFLLVEILNRFRVSYLILLLIPLLFFPFAIYDLVHIIYHSVTWPLQFVFILFIIKRYKVDVRAIKHKLFYFMLLNVICILPFLLVNIIRRILWEQTASDVTMFPLSFAFSCLICLGLIYYRNLTLLNHSHFENLSFLKKVSTFEKRNILEKISAGLVHEIKNPLTVVKSLTQQLQEEDRKINKKERAEYYRIIEEEVVRMQELCGSFLLFNKKGNLDGTETFSLKERLEEVAGLIRFEIRKRRVELAIKVNENISLDFNAYQFRQIVINLIYNALEAGARRISIRADEDEKGTGIFFTDNGKGIPKHLRKTIFKPFFTTREDGTGMGLVICREILHNNGGNIYLLDTPGETSFKIVIYKQDKQDENTNS